MKSFLIIFLLTPFAILAQDFPINNDGKIEYTEVIADSSNAESLYGRAKSFIASVFKNPREVLQLDDAENRMLIVVGTIAATPGHIKFKATIQCRDGRYKYSITDLTHTYINPAGYNLSGGALENQKPDNPIDPNVFMKLKAVADADMRNMIERLKKMMREQDNW